MIVEYAVQGVGKLGFMCSGAKSIDSGSICISSLQHEISSDTRSLKKAEHRLCFRRRRRRSGEGH
jgi:hypothetical protein